MQKETFAARRDKLRALMREAGLSAFVVSLDANRYYLSGFELQDAQCDESAGRLVVMVDGKDWLCTDARYLDAARQLWDKSRIFIYRGNAAEQINGLLHDLALEVVGFEAKIMSLDFYEALSRNLAMQRADGLVEKLRMIKEPEEIACMRRACTLNHKLMEWVPGVLVPGRTEAQAAWDIEQFFRNHGAEGLSFSSIVAVGPNAALPHAIPGEARITEECGVLVDVGCRLNAYCSDQTRSFWVGKKPHPHFTANLKLIKEAQSLAIEAIHPGVLCKDVYAVARGFLDSKKVGQYFTHGLGHGIGLQTHEGPSLNPLNGTPLQPGMIVTVEPGLYHAGDGGVRWEHMVLVTEGGAEVL